MDNEFRELKLKIRALEHGLEDSKKQLDRINFSGKIFVGVCVFLTVAIYIFSCYVAEMYYSYFDVSLNIEHSIFESESFWISYLTSMFLIVRLRHFNKKYRSGVESK